jgi:hypothetical protein
VFICVSFLNVVVCDNGWYGEQGKSKLTGNVPFLWMCSRDLTMSGMESDSAQSQSSRSSFFGNLF